MTGFLKRLGWYVTGLSIGVVFLAFFLKKKSGEGGLDFCYMPNCRVLKDIRSKKFVIGHEKKLDFEDLDIDLKKILRHGSVDFKRSDTQTAPCKTYVIAHERDSAALEVKNCPDVAYVQWL